MADESSAVTTAAQPQATNAATPGVRATAASLEPSLPARRPRQAGRRASNPKVDWWRTPPELFAALCERYGFTVDAAAAPENALLPRYWSIDDDGLAQDWNGERVWCNPPYSAIEPFVAKAAGMESGLAVLLVPANRTEQDWWQRWVEPHRDNGGPLSVRFLRSRVRFLSPETGKPGDAPPFGCALLIWNRLPS